MNKEETNRMLKTLISNLPGMVYRCRNVEDWYMDYMSEGCLKITGYKAENFIHNKKLGFGEIIYSEDRQYVWEEVQQSIAKHRHFEVEYRICTADKQIRWVWERGMVVDEAEDGTEYLEGFIMDITENYMAQEALKESEEKYRVLAETARDIICIHDLEGKITYLNTSGLDQLEETKENIYGKNIIEYLSEDSISSVRKRKEMRRKGFQDRLIYETVLNKKSGKAIPVEVSSSLIQKNGKKQGVLLIARDITERKVAEEEIRRSEEMYRGLFETTGTATIVYDNKKYIRMCNRKFEELYGKNRQEIINKLKWTDFVHQEELPRMKEYHRLRGQGSTTPPTEYEFKFVRANGEVRIVYHTVKFFMGSKERIASFADITDLKEAEQALRISEERLKLAIDGGELGLWDWNAKTGNVFFNENWARMLGYKVEELTPKVDTWKNMVHPEDWPEVERQLNDHLMGRTNIYSSEHRLLCKNGEYRWVLDTGKVVNRDAKGNPLRVAGIHKDVTERKEAEIKLKNWNKELEQRVQTRTAQLEETNKELESFSYSVSHDLKAPLRAIEGFSKVLEEDYRDILDSEGKRYLNIIRDNTIKMNQLITDLLHFSRLGRKSLKPKRTNTRSLVDEVVDEVSREIDTKNHTIIINELPDLYADRNMMKIVFSNLISNAIKFSTDRTDPRIEIGSVRADNYHQFYVKDNGVGFNMKYASKLFDTFQRLHRDEEYKGSGIGLSLVQRVINKHGGKIWAEGEENNGAVFYFYLPEIENAKKNN
jgi:PAS domain S-box-containing protein